MPDNIERVFIDSGVNLFPFSLADIRSRCTCPDQANPCKHIGAVYYQLGDRFSVDPLLLLQLRGRTKSQILEALPERAIREIMEGEANDLGLQVTPGKLADWQQRAIGNPMLAKRVVKEEYLGLEGNNFDILAAVKRTAIPKPHDLGFCFFPGFIIIGGCWVHLSCPLTLRCKAR